MKALQGYDIGTFHPWYGAALANRNSTSPDGIPNVDYGVKDPTQRPVLKAVRIASNPILGPELVLKSNSRGQPSNYHCIPLSPWYNHTQNYKRNETVTTVSASVSYITSGEA